MLGHLQAAIASTIHLPGEGKWGSGMSQGASQSDLEGVASWSQTHVLVFRKLNGCAITFQKL